MQLQTSAFRSPFRWRSRFSRTSTFTQARNCASGIEIIDAEVVVLEANREDLLSRENLEVRDWATAKKRYPKGAPARARVLSVNEGGLILSCLHAANRARIAHPSDGFYIADNPISLQNLKKFGFYENIGFAVPGIEIYMPASNELTIAWFSDSYIEEFSDAIKKAQEAKLLRPIGAFRIVELSKGPREFLEAAKSGNPILGSRMNTMNVNALQVCYAERFVYSRNDNFELARKILNDDPNLRSGPRGRVD
jgi:hypothetical protein